VLVVLSGLGEGPPAPGGAPGGGYFTRLILWT
jgi:hypothetical protein